ncbi:MAG: hypothetical protein CTY29_10300 [Methylobacter sp.]|nr:MAG: hypothetical protein CTY29_10300 [Methylobacter sp.]
MRKGSLLKRLFLSVFTGFLLILAQSGSALSEAEKQAIQNQLNQQTINKAFDPDNPADLEAYLDDAVQKGIKPPVQPPQHWQPGYTCNDILGFGYSGYRNCMLYYRYYGCYYC